LLSGGTSSRASPAGALPAQAGGIAQQLALAAAAARPRLMRDMVSGASWDAELSRHLAASATPRTPRAAQLLCGAGAVRVATKASAGTRNGWAEARGLMTWR